VRDQNIPEFQFLSQHQEGLQHKVTTNFPNNEYNMDEALEESKEEEFIQLGLL